MEIDEIHITGGRLPLPLLDPFKHFDTVSQCDFRVFSGNFVDIFWFHSSGPVKHVFNTLRLRQNGRHFADDTFKLIFFNENVRISIKISLKFVPKGPINNIPALVQIMAWRRSGDKPLSEPMMYSLQTHICITRPQWVKWTGTGSLLVQLMVCCLFLVT